MRWIYSWFDCESKAVQTTSPDEFVLAHCHIVTKDAGVSLQSILRRDSVLPMLSRRQSCSPCCRMRLRSSDEQGSDNGGELSQRQAVIKDAAADHCTAQQHAARQLQAKFSYRPRRLHIRKYMYAGFFLGNDAGLLGE